jgi:hypothetical protein
MGITVSHTNYAPISLISACIGFVSFTFTLATFFNVFWSNLGTFGKAPQEITDYLSSLKQGLLEERRHLRRVRRRLESINRDRSHGRNDSDNEHERGKKRNREGRRRRGHMHFERNIRSMQSAGEHEALSVMRVTIRDLITSFREIEQPFLKPEYQQPGPARWSAAQPPNYSEKRTYSSSQYPHSDEDSPDAQHMYGTNRLGHEYMKCGVKERWLWVRRKAAVVNLSTVLNRVEVRRTAHEVGEVLSMVCNIGRDMEDLREGLEGVEGRLNRVVGIRRVD